MQGARAVAGRPDVRATRRESTRAPAPDAGNWRDDVDTLGLSPERLEVVGDEALALALAADASPLTVDDLIANPPAPGLVPMYQEYRALFSRYHSPT